MLDEPVLVDAEDMRGGGLDRVPGRGDAGVVARVGSGDDRAQRHKVALDEHADVLVDVEAKVREGAAKVGVMALQAARTRR